MSENVKHLNDENFKSAISSGVTLVDFFADWCGPCKMIAPIINELADELQGQAVIAKVDIDASPKTTSEADVTSVPTLILFKNGVEAKRMVGVRDKKSLKAMILEVL
jgi:thioredoxin 1